MVPMTALTSACVQRRTSVTSAGARLPVVNSEPVCGGDNNVAGAPVWKSHQSTRRACPPTWLSASPVPPTRNHTSLCQSSDVYCASVTNPEVSRTNTSYEYEKRHAVFYKWTKLTELYGLHTVKVCVQEFFRFIICWPLLLLGKLCHRTALRAVSVSHLKNRTR